MAAEPEQPQIEMVDGEQAIPLGPGHAEVASKGTPGRWYDVDLGRPGGECQCMGYQTRRHCRHDRLVRAHYAGEDSIRPGVEEGADELSPGFRWSEQRTPTGFTNGEVRSAFQKEIRRGNEPA